MKAVFVISGRRSIYPARIIKELKYECHVNCPALQEPYQTQITIRKSDIFDSFELAAQAVHNRNIEDSKEFIQACQDSLANALRQYDQLIKAGPPKQ